MDKFWTDVMNGLLGVVLYHGALPDDESWASEYSVEVEGMIEDIIQFQEANKEAGIEVSDEAMAAFLVYAEHVHIGNSDMVTDCPISKNQLLSIAEKINNKLD